jgi:hypothetical protein
MIIRKYIQFINENTDEVYGEYSSFGEWVESLNNDDYIKNIITRYTSEITLDINLSNALNILDKKIQKEIKYQIEEYLNKGIQDKDVDITASTDIEEVSEDLSVAGKGTFSSFLKCITAIGKKNNIPNWEKCPNDFLIFYLISELEADVIKSIFNRFKSLTTYSEYIDTNIQTNLYFGIKCNGLLEYGVMNNENKSIIGQFKLSKSAINWIVTSNLSSLESFKKEIVNLSYNDLINLGKIKNEMISYNPGYHEKRLLPILKDRILTFGYYGIGKWENGKIDEMELQTIKDSFIDWLSTKPWMDKILISLKANSFWLYINIKIK